MDRGAEGRSRDNKDCTESPRVVGYGHTEQISKLKSEPVPAEWHVCGLEEKIDRLRQESLSHRYQLEHINQTLQRHLLAIEKLLEHQHVDGEIVIKMNNHYSSLTGSLSSTIKSSFDPLM